MANKSGRGNAISGLGKAVSEAGAWYAQAMTLFPTCSASLILRVFSMSCRVWPWNVANDLGYDVTALDGKAIAFCPQGQPERGCPPVCGGSWFGQ